MATQDLKPFAPLPAPRQLAWQKMEQYAFVHFGPNTFTDKEWGEGLEDPKIFNPSHLDCRQWARVAREAGLRGIIITAKHHDGFCLWPSKFSKHTVAQSSFKGDVLKDLSEACKAEGLKLGVYLSPWDRNHPTYGTPEYNQVFANMLHEVLTSYGPIFEVWFDGANGEGPNGKKQVYDWPLFIRTVRECQPNAVIFSDAGPDIRWVGNEAGHAAEECWSTIDRNRYVPGTPLYQELTVGKKGGKDWVPAECDVSIRPGWFYHAEEDGRVKSPETLLDLWERSVGQNGSFLLNIPPDRRGLWHENDVKALLGWRRLRNEIYAKNLATGSQYRLIAINPHGNSGEELHGWRTTDSLVDASMQSYAAATKGNSVGFEFSLPRQMTFDRVELREPIQLGQRISKFAIEVETSGNWSRVADQTTVGARRIVRIPRQSASKVRVLILNSLAEPALSGFGLYWTGK